MNTKIKHRFEYRFEAALSDEIKRVQNKLGISKSKLMRIALHSAVHYYKDGLFHNLIKSDFLHRIDISDKIRFELALDKKDRDILRKLAFTWRISQAEVMRMVLEFFVHVIHGTTTQEIESYNKKVRYTQPIPAPMLVVYDIFNSIESRWHIFRPPKAWIMFVAV